MTLFTKIGKLHTFREMHDKAGRRPLPGDISTIEDAELLVGKNGEVVWAGPASERPKQAARAKKISLKGCDVLPAFTECHTHLLYAGSRADEFERRNRGDSYLEISLQGGGIKSTVRATAKASDRELEAGLKKRLLEFASQGVTTVEIKTGYAGTIADEKRHLEILVKLRRLADRDRKLPRVVITCLAAHSIPADTTEEAWLDAIETKLLEFVAKEKIRLDIFIEKGAFSRAGGERLLTAARKKGIKLAIHSDQLSLSGGTELGVAFEAQSVDHVIEVGTKEIAALAKSKTVAVLLPAADLYTRLPYPKARAMIDQGVRVAVATDHNPGSSPGLDLALVGLLARAGMQMTLPEVLAAYTVNAAAALGFESRLGALQPGFSADFLCLKPGMTLTDLFYEVGPTRSHSAIAAVWREGHKLA